MVNQNGSLILDIPHPMLTAVSDVQTLAARVESTWGGVVSDIVYPGLWIGGLTTKNLRLSEDDQGHPWQSLDDVVAMCHDRGWKLWLELELDLKSVRSELVYVRDFYGSVSSHACINSPATHRALGTILDKLASVVETHGKGCLTGVVLPIQDLWPMSGHDLVLELTCFCQHCREFISNYNPTLLGRFQRIPNAWNLALDASGTGINHLWDITSQTPPEVIVTLSQARELYANSALRKAKDPQATLAELTLWATWLKEYMGARHALTTHALQGITEILREKLGAGITVAVVLGDLGYDWTAGVYLDRFLNEQPFDEIWIDIANRGTRLEQTAFRYYLWDRARYYVSAMFTSLENTQSPTQKTLSELTGAALQRSIRRTSARCLGARPSVLTRDLLPPEANAALGLVVPPLYDDIVESLVAKFRAAPENDSKDPDSLLESLLGMMSPG